jgi:hypothetical protein
MSRLPFLLLAFVVLAVADEVPSNEEGLLTMEMTGESEFELNEAGEDIHMPNLLTSLSNAGGRHLLRSRQAPNSRGTNRIAQKKKSKARNKLHSMNKAHAKHIRSSTSKKKKKVKASVRCQAPDSPSNGSVKTSHQNVGGTASYSCNKGFTVEGAF